MRRVNAGFSVTELLLAGSVATVLGGITLTLFTAATQVFTANTTYTELSGYLDATDAQLKRDIRQAQRACDHKAVLCPSACWLGLVTDISAWNNGDIRYTIDGSNRLIREVRTAGSWGPPRVMAHHVDTSLGGDGQPVTKVDVGGAANRLVTFILTVKKTALGGRVYTRKSPSTSYQIKAP